MKNIFKIIDTIHFIGIGGVSMKALAQLSFEMGLKVTGSDLFNREDINNLSRIGIEAYLGSNVDIVQKANLVVYNSAIKEDDIELIYALSKGIKCIERKEYLKILSNLCNKCVAIAGTHGKTTVSAMIACILKESEFSIIGHIGGDYLDSKSNLINTIDFKKNQKGDYFVSEACEYKKNFLTLTPNIAVVLNIEYDHPDYYTSLKEVEIAFHEFISKIPKNGVLVTTKEIKDKFNTNHLRVLTVGSLRDNNYYAKKIRYINGLYSFEVVKDGKNIGRVNPIIAGKHNIFNTLISIATCIECGVSTEGCIRLASQFKGIRRRFECKGMSKTMARIISDYAHHPSEIKATIDTARCNTQNRIVAVFEPHTYSRTVSMIDDFVESFFWCDEVLFLPTYGAREEKIEGGTGKDIFEKFSKKRTCGFYFNDYSTASKHLLETTKKGDTILLLGAGSIDTMADMLI